MVSLDDHFVSLLRFRETMVKSNYIRYNWNLMARVVKSDGREFKKVHEEKRNESIHYESERLFFKKSLKTVSSRTFRKLFHVELLQNEKVEDSLLAECTSLTCCPREMRLLIMVTNKQNVICTYSDSGGIHARFHLPDYQFNRIYWCKEGESFAVSGRDAFPRRLGAQMSNAGVMSPSGSRRIDQHAFCLFLFGFGPLQLIASFVISPKVFGSMENVIICQDMLVIMRAGNLIQFFSMEHILAMERKLDVDLNFILKHMPSERLPITIEILEKPAVLWELNCSNHIAELGGGASCWYCLYRPVKSSVDHGRYCIEDMFNPERKVVDQFGLLPTDNHVSSIRGVQFHPDESGRILFVENYKDIRVLKIKDNDEGALPSLAEELFLPASTFFSTAESLMSVSTRSGRAVKYRFYSDNADRIQYIDDVHYDEAFDWLIISAFSSEESAEGSITLIMVDQTSGQVMRRLPLQWTWNDMDEHFVHFDLDTVVHIVRQHPGSRFLCNIYRLQEIQKKKPKPEAKSCSSRKRKCDGSVAVRRSARL